MYIYTAGTLTHLYHNNQFHLATEWRNKLETFAKDNNIKIFNPATTFLTEKNHTYNDRMAVKQNDYYLNKTDIMVVQLDYIDFSPGTQYELTTYKQLYPWKPVIAFGKSYHWSPHIMSCITERCNNIDEIIKLLCNMFGQSL